MIPRRGLLDRRRDPGSAGSAGSAGGGRRDSGPPGTWERWRRRLGIDRLGVVGSSLLAGLILVVGVAVFALLGGERFGPPPGAMPTPVGSLPPGSQPPDRRVAAFLALATSPDLAMHVLAKTTATVGETAVTVTTDLDHRGGGHAGVVTVTEEGRVGTTDVVVLPPDAYVRETGGPWRKGAAPKRPIDPFFGLTAETPVADLGSEVVDGVELRRLRLALLPVDTTFDPDVREVRYDATAFDLWVDAEGRPVKGSFRLDGSALTHEGAEREQRVPVTIATDFTFSRVGEPVEIVAPPA